MQHASRAHAPHAVSSWFLESCGQEDGRVVDPFMMLNVGRLCMALQQRARGSSGRCVSTEVARAGCGSASQAERDCTPEERRHGRSHAGAHGTAIAMFSAVRILAERERLLRDKLREIV
jgi:hypothetical protein